MADFVRYGRSAKIESFAKPSALRGLGLTFRPSVIASALVVASALIASVAGAECIRVPAQRRLNDKAHELVFNGTVVEITRTDGEGYWATFNVDRVWKGSVSRRFNVFVWERAPESDHFELLHSYVVFAQRLTDP